MLNFKSRKETCVGLLLFIDGALRLTLTSGRVHCSSLRLCDHVKNYLPCGEISCLPNNINSASSSETSVILYNFDSMGFPEHCSVFCESLN
jgi:hypothetical protein